jgi:hypothetical protein
MAGVSLVVMQLSRTTAQTQVDAQSTAEMMQLTSQLSSMFSNDYDCAASFKDVTFNGASIKANPIDVELWYGDQAGVRSRKFLSGTDAAFKKFGKIAISSVQLSMPDYTNLGNFPTGNDESFKAEVKISGDKTKMGKQSGIPSITKQFSLIFDTDASGLSKIKGCGSVIAGARGFGVGQTWQKMTASRSFNTPYSNSTSLPIVVNLLANITGDSGGYFYAQIDSLSPIPLAHWNKLGGSYPIVGHVIVPAGSTYIISYIVIAGASPTITDWFELRN